jgi:hypothetical protein
MDGSIISPTTTFIPVQGRLKLSENTNARSLDQILSTEHPAQLKKGARRLSIWPGPLPQLPRFQSGPGAEFCEGLVAKRADSACPIQFRDPEAGR